MSCLSSGWRENITGVCGVVILLCSCCCCQLLLLYLQIPMDMSSIQYNKNKIPKKPNRRSATQKKKQSGRCGQRCGHCHVTIPPPSPSSLEIDATALTRRIARCMHTHAGAAPSISRETRKTNQSCVTLSSRTPSTPTRLLAFPWNLPNSRVQSINN